jgi:hypothetical protein
MPTYDATISCTSYLERRDIRLLYGESFGFGLPWKPHREPLLQDDLLKVAGVVFVADRAFRRHPRLGDWTRSFACTMKVAEPKRWANAAAALTKAVSFLTDDSWSFEFLPVDRKRSMAGRMRADARGESVDGRCGPVALFSGGLDSFCGACCLLGGQQASRRTPIFVSSYVTGLDRLTNLVSSIAGAAGDARFMHLPVHGATSAVRIRGLDTATLPERSRRSRSLYFVFQAIAAAIEFAVDEVQLYENGVLAINLPLRADDSGSRSTRHAHPHYIALVNRLVEALRGEASVVLTNPFALQTKSEILRHVDARSRELIAQTVSCWGYPNAVASARARRPGVTHCGRCLPCLIRRLALRSAGVTDKPSIYQWPNLYEAAQKGFAGRSAAVWSQARKLAGFARRIGDVQPPDLIWRFGGHFLHLAPCVDKRELRAAHDLYVRFSAEVERALAP